MDELYRDQILEHYKRPHNFGRIEGADLEFEDTNPLCGDELKVMLKVDDDRVVTDVRFDGHGCAISQASASMASDREARGQGTDVRNPARRPPRVGEAAGYPGGRQAHAAGRRGGEQFAPTILGHVRGCGCGKEVLEHPEEPARPPGAGVGAAVAVELDATGDRDRARRRLVAPPEGVGLSHRRRFRPVPRSRG